METKNLSARQRWALKHMNRAEEQGIALSEYAKRHGLSAPGLYMTKSRLKREGKLSSGLPVPAKPTLGEFIGVRLAPTSRPLDGFGRCRLRHPSGWVIECGELPEVSWVRALLAGGEHAAAE